MSETTKKTMAQLRAEQSTARPERPYRAVVGEGKKYAAETLRLTVEHDDLMTGVRRDPDASTKPRRLTDKATPPRVLEIRDRLAELAQVMGEYEGELLVRATKTDGEWEQWRLDHPARDEDAAGGKDDAEITNGHCNSTDLIEDLATYVVSWEGEELGHGGYEALNLMRPDKKAIAALVVSMYEDDDELPFLLRGLSGFLTSARPSS